MVRTGSFTHLPQVPVETRARRRAHRALARAVRARARPPRRRRARRARGDGRRTRPRSDIAAFSDLEAAFTARGGYVAEAESRGSRRASGCARSCSLEDLARCRAASAGASTSCACSTRARARWCSTSRPTTSTAPPSGGSSASSRRSRARSCSSATTWPCSTRPSTRCSTSTRAASTSTRATTRRSCASPPRRARAARLLAKREDTEIRRLKAFADARRHSTEKQARKAKIADRKVERLEANRTRVAPRSGPHVPPARAAAQRRRRARDLGAPRRLRPPRRARGDLDARRARRPDPGRRPQRRGQVEPAALPRRRAGPDGGHAALRGERRARLLRPGARAARRVADRARAHGGHPLKTEVERRKLLGAFGLAGETVQHRPTSSRAASARSSGSPSSRRAG